MTASERGRPGVNVGTDQLEEESSAGVPGKTETADGVVAMIIGNAAQQLSGRAQ